MFNVNFTTLEQGMKLNNLTEPQLVHHIQQYFKNQNYRKGYNAKKSEILKRPEVKALLKKMK